MTVTRTPRDALLNGVVDVVLPCLNEAAALPWVLGRIPAGWRAVVVDNGSDDGSAAIARDLGAIVVEEPRRGFGAACHAGLLAAVGAVADDWPEADRTVAAAVLDVLWGVATYERLAVDWGLDPDRAVAGIAWLATLVEEAVRTGRRPLAD